MLRRFTAPVLVLAFMAAASTASTLTKAVSLPPAHFAETATVVSEPIGIGTSVTTERGWQEKRGLLGLVPADTFLRAVIDRRSGATVFQVYQRLNYVARDWRFYRAASYETAAGPVDVETVQLAHDVDCTGSRSLQGCMYREEVAYIVPEAVLRSIAALYRPGQALAWRMRFTARSGDSYKDGLAPAEVVGFLQVVDRERGAQNAG
jgi:hypothetical protein